MTITINLTITSAGLQPTAPLDLYNQLVAEATSLDPSLTTNLPGALIEDIASTSTGALVVIDTALVDLVNSISPTNASPFILNQLGQCYGVSQGLGSNASVYVVFTGPVGFFINKGFTVSDGTNQYVVQDGGTIGSGGTTSSLYCVAVQSGVFAIPANTVTTVLTSLPPAVTITCTNPLAGTPANAAQTTQQYQAQVIQAGQATAQGVPAFLKTQLQKVSGVQQRLISIQQQGSTWVVVCGGGDPYQVAGAIYSGMPDISTLAGSTLNVTNITQANPGVVTTDIPHGYTTGATVTMTGIVGMVTLNGVPKTITVVDAYHFSIATDTTGYPAYVSGGVCSPNLRNELVSIQDYPDTYQIPFVVPLLETVAITCQWQSISPNYVSPATVSGLVIPGIVSYVNSIYTGQPLNVLELEAVFISAVATILPANLISKLNFAVTINGVLVNPIAGETIIPGDNFSYFYTTSANITVQAI